MKGKYVKKLFVLAVFIIITLLSTTIFAVESIITNNYIVVDNVIMKVEAGTTVKQFLDNISVNSGASKSVYKGNTKASDSELVGTGMLLKVGNDTTYNIAVRGDANGDAKVSATDLSLFKMHYTHIKTLEGIYEKAIDINCDMKISMVDLSLLKMILVGLPLPGTDNPDVEGDITILPDTTNYVKELGITVYWPEDANGLVKQISLDNGNTFQNYTGKVTMTENNTVIARLINSNNNIVKSASLVVTNIDSEGPEAFDVNVEHKITNYTVLSGETTDGVSGLAGYYFSYDGGNTWNPVTGQLRGEYLFTDVPANSTIQLRMKAMDKVGNETLTNVKDQRTFKKGIEILKENLADVVIDGENQIITMPDGRIFRLAITENGGYAIISVGDEEETSSQLVEEELLNSKIAEYEANGVLSDTEILNRLTEEGYGDGTVENGLFTTEQSEQFVQYRLTTNIDGKHQLVFLKTVTKNGLTSSGQIKENETLIALEDMINEMLKDNPNTTIIEILDKAVTDGLLLEENVNRNNGRFETEVGLVYEIVFDEESEERSYTVELIGFAEDVDDGYIQQKLEDVLEQGLKNQIIDWAIQDGLTTEDKVSRTNGMYEATNGAYKQVVIDMEKGTYDTIQIDRPEGAIIEYTLNPDFPTMTNKTILTVTAKGETGISKIEVFTELGESILSKTYSDGEATKSENIDITYNGTYKVVVTTADGKVSEKEILICNIASLLPIKVTISPESPRNTTKEGIQNDVATGPITVTLVYSAAPLLENEDKYQYQLNGTDGEWQTAEQTQLIENITKNCKIYARYFDGEKSVKQVEIVIDTVDNVAPNAFEYTTSVTSNTITVDAITEDTAADSDGNKAREGVEGVSRYMYKLNDGEWQADNVFEKLTQKTEYNISVKAIDHAGNETLATNSNTPVSTEEVPNAKNVITFEYSETGLTKENVKVTFKSSINNDVYKMQYQVISDGSQPVEENWVDGEEYEATGNCKIYVRLIDSTGQVNAANEYAVAEIKNIDNMGPTEFTPKAIATTKDSITIHASSVDPGEAKDAPETSTTASSGTVRYDYYITGTSGITTKIEEQTEYTYTFTGLEQGSLYSIYVIATDAVGNSTVSTTITVVTNGTLNEYANAHTTITGLIEDAAFDNPVIPEGFAPVNENGAEWGDGTTKPEGVQEGLVIRDRDGNEFVWVPVDGENVVYEKWATDGISYEDVQDGEAPVINEEVLSEIEQIEKYGGFYVSRTEASKNGSTPVTKIGEKPWTGLNYANAKEKAESMYDKNTLKSGLLTGTQWDTLIKWLSTTNEDILTSKEYGNFTGVRQNTGSSDQYRINNIYDLSGNVQEFTNEVQNNQVVVRGGAYDLEKTLTERYVYGKEYSNADLGFRTTLYVIETEELEPSDPGSLGIGNINKGPGNITINGGEPSYLNPVVPVGFKAINTDDAKWYGLPTPNDWNKGLVIEDENGSQFVWVPVDGNKIKYEKWYTIYAPSSVTEEEIAGDEVPLPLEALGVQEQQQIETYGGFYVARYEAGNSEGVLASKAGTRTINAITYAEAKEYAEAMYTNPYVKSGLLTGTAWDTTMSWMASTNGENRVLNDKLSGNNVNTEFVFSGEYAVGPNSTKELRGEYQTGTNVTKPEGERMLLATGLTDAFKTNNIYDMAGNVWEYTYEYTINAKDNKEYIARGADYYRQYPQAANWGAAIRENVVVEVAERRNEGGFRVMLYLVEGKAEVGKFEDFNRTMTGEGATFDNPIIPAGYAPVNKGANWGNGTKETIEWNDGLVIEDQDGNEFVWVPVDTTDVEYKKWIQTGISYKETDDENLPEKVKGWGENEATQIYKYGGFYIARYEASKLIKETDITAGSKPNADAWVNIDYVTAKDMAEKLETKDTVSSGLVTGTAWDTVMRWIANEKGNISYVTEDSTSWGYYTNSELGNDAQAKNIYVLAGGSWEWTAEKVGDNAVYRGGVKTDRGDSSPAGYRGTKGTTTLDSATSFRMMLYVTGDVQGAATKPVSDSEPLPGTKFPNIVNAPKLVEGMTPVKWNGVNWVTTTEDDVDWYSYVDTSLNGEGTSKWANAKTPDGSMWVWIPRYAYKIEDNQTISILFLDEDTNESLEVTDEVIYANQAGNITSKTNYIVHPAFRGNTSIGGWTKELEGIWVGKFETSGNSPSTLASKPNVSSFGYDNQGSTQFDYALRATLGFTNLGNLPNKPSAPVRKYEYTQWDSEVYYLYNGKRYSSYTTAMNQFYTDMAVYNSALENYRANLGIDVHMAKNTEWGAAAYLAHSVYGVNGAVVQENPTSTAGYQYTTNVNQSTTGNVYGIYDMAGGRMEYASAYVNNFSSARLGNIINIVTANLKYKQVYGSYGYYGDAVTETAGWQGSPAHNPNSYYWDHGTPRPLYVRGAVRDNSGATSGGANTIFATSVQCSNANYAYSFRMILVNNE